MNHRVLLNTFIFFCATNLLAEAPPNNGDDSQDLVLAVPRELPVSSRRLLSLAQPLHAGEDSQFKGEWLARVNDAYAEQVRQQLPPGAELTVEDRELPGRPANPFRTLARQISETMVEQYLPVLANKQFDNAERNEFIEKFTSVKVADILNPDNHDNNVAYVRERLKANEVAMAAARVGPLAQQLGKLVLGVGKQAGRAAGSLGKDVGKDIAKDRLKTWLVGDPNEELRAQLEGIQQCIKDMRARQDERLTKIGSDAELAKGHCADVMAQTAVVRRAVTDLRRLELDSTKKILTAVKEVRNKQQETLNEIAVSTTDTRGSLIRVENVLRLGEGVDVLTAFPTRAPTVARTRSPPADQG